MRGLTKTEETRCGHCLKYAVEIRFGFAVTLLDQHLIERGLLELRIDQFEKRTIHATDKARRLLNV